MVTGRRPGSGMDALQKTLVVARHLASSGVDKAELVVILDVVEFLIVLIQSAEDRTLEFKGHISDLARRWPLMNIALADFHLDSE